MSDGPFRSVKEMAAYAQGLHDGARSRSGVMLGYDDLARAALEHVFAYVQDEEVLGADDAVTVMAVTQGVELRDLARLAMEWADAPVPGDWTVTDAAREGFVTGALIMARALSRSKARA